MDFARTAVPERPVPAAERWLAEPHADAGSGERPAIAEEVRRLVRVTAQQWRLPPPRERR